MLSRSMFSHSNVSHNVILELVLHRQHDHKDTNADMDLGMDTDTDCLLLM